MIVRLLRKVKKVLMVTTITMTLLFSANSGHAIFGVVTIDGILSVPWATALDTTTGSLPDISGSLGSAEGTAASTEGTLVEWEGKQTAYNTRQKVLKGIKWSMTGLVTIASSFYFGMLGEAIKQNVKGNTGHNMGQKFTQDQSSKSHKAVYGSTSTFANMMKAYKQPNKVCSGQGDNKQCYNATNAGTMSNHLKFKSEKHENAAKQYAQYASGGAIGTPEPSKKMNNNPNPSTIKYHAYYKNQAAMGSHATNQMAQAIGNRQVTKSGGKTHSKLSIYDKSRRQQPQKNNTPSSMPTIFSVLFGQLSNAMKIPQTAHSIVNGVEDASHGVSTVVSQASSMVHHAFGKQMWENAMNEVSGEVNKKLPWG